MRNFCFVVRIGISSSELSSSYFRRKIFDGGDEISDSSESVKLRILRRSSIGERLCRDEELFL